MKILFICNQKKNRSKTAELLFQKRFDARSAGLYNSNPVNEEDLHWADVIVVMEDAQRSEIGRRFPSAYLQKRIVSLDIPDIYRCNDPALVELLKQRMAEVI